VTIAPFDRGDVKISTWAKGVLPFVKLQALPKDGKAVTAWLDRDEALVNIAEGVRRVVDALIEK
jgi:hypothetical protein